VLASLSPRRLTQHHIASPPAGTDKRLTPIKTHGPGAILPGHLCGIGLDLVAAP
jgi:hypothetical protein